MLLARCLAGEGCARPLECARCERSEPASATPAPSWRPAHGIRAIKPRVAKTRSVVHGMAAKQRFPAWWRRRAASCVIAQALRPRGPGTGSSAAPVLLRHSPARSVSPRPGLNGSGRNCPSSGSRRRRRAPARSAHDRGSTRRASGLADPPLRGHAGSVRSDLRRAVAGGGQAGALQEAGNATAPGDVELQAGERHATSAAPQTVT